MSLDLSSLQKAIHSLDATLQKSNDEKLMSQLDDVIRLAVRAGAIQNFEFTYELCWKFIKRWIRENGSPEDADHPRTRKDLFRLAAQYSLIKDPAPWFDYGNARNLMSHTYDQEKAREIYSITRGFLSDAVYLLKQLEENND